MTDATVGRGGVGIRLFTSGGEMVRRTFDQVGDSGKKMWAEIALGQKATNPAFRALSSGMDEARGGVDALASRTGVASNVLGAFGFAGITAAAALGGLAVGMTKAREAMAFADEIDDAAQKLGIGTSALQEYRFAMTEVGGATTDADRAIEGFQKKLGEAMGGGRAKKWFDQIGIGPEQLRSFKSTEDALSTVLDGISKLGTEAERAAVAEKLGLGPMVALARDGTVALEALRQKARDIGYVMDEDLVKKGADANQKFETMAQIIDVQLKSAFVGLSDEVLTFTGYIAAALGKLNEFVGNFYEQKAKITSILGKETVDALMRGDSAQAAVHLGRRYASGDVGRMQAAWANGETDVDDPMLQRGRAANEARNQPHLNGAGNHLQDRSSGGGASRAAAAAARAEREAEQRRQRTERYEAQRDRLHEDILRSESKLLLSIDEAAALDTDVIERERLAKLKEIVAAQAEYARTNGLRGLSEVEAAQLVEAHNYLAAQKKEVREEERRRDQAARRLQDDETAAQAAIDMLGIDAALAKTAGERARIQREILTIEQKIARDRLKLQLETDKELNGDQVAAQLGDLDRRQAGERTLFDHNESERLREQFKSYGREVAGAIKDGRLGEYIGDQVKAKLLDGALDALFNVMQGGSKSNTGNWVNAAVSFGKSLFGGGRASGGDFKSGFSYGIAEHGPELAVFGTDGKVFSARDTAAMLRGMGSGGGSASQGTVVQQTLVFDAKGAVMTADLLNQFNAMADQAALRGAAMGADHVRRSAAGMQKRQRRLGTS